MIMIMIYFRLNVLMCTSVAAMGCHTSGLNLGIALGDLLKLIDPFQIYPSPGVASNTWTMVQQAGRVGRKDEEQAVFVTVAEKSSNTRGKFHQHNCLLFMKIVFSWFQFDHLPSCSESEKIVFLFL